MQHPFSSGRNGRSFAAQANCLGFLGFAALMLVSPVFAGVTQTGGTLGKGTAWETHYYMQKSDVPGPTVVITGGVHGDEPAGAAAAEQIRHWPIGCGTLVVLPQANPPALAAHSRTIPNAEKEVGNLNRNFPKAKDSNVARGEAAVAIWEWLQSLKPAWVVDLHEGRDARASGSKSVGSTAIVFPSAEANAAAEAMLAAVNATIDKEEKKFVRVGPPVDGSLARAAGKHLGTNAMILETSINEVSPTASAKTAKKPASASKTGATSKTKSTSKASTTSKTASTSKSASSSATASTSPPKQQPLSRRVRQHRIMVHALLAHLGMIDAKLSVDQLAGRAAAPEKTWVALYDAGGTGGAGASKLHQLLREIGMQVVRVGPEELAAGVPSQFDLLIVPGGSGSKEAAAIGEKGRQNIRQFVEQGGGYLGVCAGAYLCTSGYEWSLKILDAKTVSPKWSRGRATLKMELTPEGRKILGDHPGLIDVLYHNGPVVTGAGVESLPDYEVLAYFRTEVAKNNAPEGLQVNSPAIASGRCGRGRVMFISPHPEQTAGLEDLVRRAALWAATKP